MVRLRGFVLVRLLEGLHEMKQVKLLPTEPGMKSAQMSAAAIYTTVTQR